MTEARPYIVCTPTAVLDRANIPGAVVRWCSICGESVWASPSGIKGIEERGFIPICMVCAPGALQGDGKFFIATSQREELRAAGMSDEEIDAVGRAATKWVEATGKEEER